MCGINGCWSLEAVASLPVAVHSKDWLVWDISPLLPDDIQRGELMQSGAGAFQAPPRSGSRSSPSQSYAVNTRAGRVER